MNAGKWPMFVMTDGVLHFYDSELDMTFIIRAKGSKTPLTVDVATAPSDSIIAIVLPTFSSLSRDKTGYLQLTTASVVYPSLSDSSLEDSDVDELEEPSAGPSTSTSARTRTGASAPGRKPPAKKKVNKPAAPATSRKKGISMLSYLVVTITADTYFQHPPNLSLILMEKNRAMSS